MTEVSGGDGDLLKLRYQANYAFARKVIRGSEWFWYAGIVVTVLQAIVMLSVGMQTHEMLNNMYTDIHIVIQILTCVQALTVTILSSYAGSLALGALGRSLKANVDSAVNSSRELRDDVRMALLLST